MLLIVKYGKHRIDGRGKQNSTSKRSDPFQFEKWKSRNSQSTRSM
jgi:hypothetical protein